MKFKPIVLTALLSLVHLSHQGSPPPPSSSSSSWSFDSFPDAFWDLSQGSGIAAGFPPLFSPPAYHHHDQQPTSTFFVPPPPPPFHIDHDNQSQQQEEQIQQKPAEQKKKTRRKKALLIRDSIEYPPSSAPLIDLIRARPTNVHRAHTQRYFATFFRENDQVKAIDLENLTSIQIAHAFSMLYPNDIDSITKQRLTYAIKEYLEHSGLDKEKKDATLFYLSTMTKKAKLMLREHSAKQSQEREKQQEQEQEQGPEEEQEEANQDQKENTSYDHPLSSWPTSSHMENQQRQDIRKALEEEDREKERTNPFVAHFHRVGLPTTASGAIQLAQSIYPNSGLSQSQTTRKLLKFLYAHYPREEVIMAKRPYDLAVRATARTRRRDEHRGMVQSLSKSERIKGGSLGGGGGGGGSSSSSGGGRRRAGANAIAMEIDGSENVSSLDQDRYGMDGHGTDAQGASDDQYPFLDFPHWLQEGSHPSSGGSEEGQTFQDHYASPSAYHAGPHLSSFHSSAYPHSNTFGQVPHSAELPHPYYTHHEQVDVDHPPEHFLPPHSTEPVSENYAFWYNMYQQTKDDPNQPPPI